MRRQRTLAQPFEMTGAGLFHGEPATLRVSAAPPGTGVVFVRTDLPGAPRIPAVVDSATPSHRRTVLAVDGAEVECTEHLLAALAGMGIDNCVAEISGREVPAMDGSAYPFVEAVRRAGVVEQDAGRAEIVVTEPVSVTEGDASLVALPAAGEGLTVSYTLNYEHTPIGAQHFTITVLEGAFAKELAPARTFCLQSEVEAFRREGLGKGATAQNTLVVGDAGVIDNPLRFPNEFVRHKILDLVGDLSLAGRSLRAHVVGTRSGHALNVRLARKLARLGAGDGAPARRQETWLDVRELFKILPHRYPFLLIDKVVELEGWQRAVGIKNVTINEPYFNGHFPGRPIMPGVLQLEAMAQLAGALLMRKAENANKLAVLLSLDEVKLRRTVVPGDQLRIEAEVLRLKSRTGFVRTKASVDGQVASEAQMKFMLVDPE